MVGLASLDVKENCLISVIVERVGYLLGASTPEEVVIFGWSMAQASSLFQSGQLAVSVL
jgi:hypothetical protein